MCCTVTCWNYVTRTGINGMKICCGFSLPVTIHRFWADGAMPHHRSWGRASSARGCSARENYGVWMTLRLTKSKDFVMNSEQYLGTWRDYGLKSTPPAKRIKSLHFTESDWKSQNLYQREVTQVVWLNKWILLCDITWWFPAVLRVHMGLKQSASSLLHLRIVF